MSRLPLPLTSEPGPECYCGSELRKVPLPVDIAPMAGVTSIWVHVYNGDTRCYPESSNPEDAAATGEPAP
jgi:hypothetical protein